MWRALDYILMTLKTYSWLLARGLLLMVLEGLNVVPKIEPVLYICQAISLPTLLTLWPPQVWFLLCCFLLGLSLIWQYPPAVLSVQTQSFLD